MSSNLSLNPYSSNPNIVAIIPARMASSRFPGKPMAKILGMPMIGHVYYRTKMCGSLGEVWVATCDKEIFDYIESIGGKAVMTADTHERASDRTAEATLKIESETGGKTDIAVMVQGDEPMLVPEMIDDLINPVIDNPQIEVTNLISTIDSEEEFNNSNVVKVVLNNENDALYFSREPIPSRRKYTGEIPMWKQLGMILFSRQALLEYIDMTPTPLEIIESVDMNRLLEHGKKIKMISTKYKTHGVDTKQDLLYVEGLLKNDHLVKEYLA